MSYVRVFFNPIHSGHIDYLESAKKLGDKLFVIVNNDNQVVVKKSKPFMNETERLRIVSALDCVDVAIISLDACYGIEYSLEYLASNNRDKELIFANGGDRTPDNKNPMEDEACKRYNIKQVFNIGGKKTQSSSNILRNL